MYFCIRGIDLAPSYVFGGLRGRDRMVVVILTTYVISAYQN